jgi:D-alanine-D-alanine ligase-like ATP-grasp enzyme
MKVCVLQPDYSTTDVDYKNYDPPRNLSALLPADHVDHVFLNKLSTYRQLKELREKKYDIFVNLCEGYLEWSVPSIDVIHSLEMLNLPYTGPTALLYDPPKELMKYVAYTCGVKTPSCVLVKNISQADEITSKIDFPLFIKPAKAGDSLGIDKDSLIKDKKGLKKKISKLLEDYPEILVEEYIAGREFTVLVAADAGNKNSVVYTPVEFIFPEGNKFKTYSLKTSDLHKECNVPCNNKELSDKLKDHAAKIFKAFNGVGYARLDFRLNDANELYFLEINFTCSVFYEGGYEGSADYILLNDPSGKEGFLHTIINEGIARHLEKQKKYTVKGDSLSGYGIYAAKDIVPGEIIFVSEGKPHRLVTKKYVEQSWSAEDLQNFRKYAWPVSSEVYILWDNAPAEWSPQNHSCNPNTEYSGLNVVAMKHISAGDELTLDYTTFLNGEMESFICNCGAENCKKVIQGIEMNSITYREKNKM